MELIFGKNKPTVAASICFDSKGMAELNFTEQ